MAYDRTAQNCNAATCSCVPNYFILFYDKGWQARVFIVIKNDQFLVYLTVWVIFLKFLDWLRSGNFPQVFGLVKEWLLLELCGMIRVPHVFSCPMDFNLLCDQGQQSRVLNPTKNDQFQVFLAVWFLFPKFLDRLSHTCSCVPNCFSFVLRVRLARRGVQSYEK